MIEQGYTHRQLVNPAQVETDSSGQIAFPAESRSQSGLKPFLSSAEYPQAFALHRHQLFDFVIIGN
jgi:hypothetical protein